MCVHGFFFSVLLLLENVVLRMECPILGLQSVTCLHVHFSPTHDFSLGVLSYKLLSGTVELQILSHLFSLESNPGPLINGDYVVLTSL